MEERVRRQEQRTRARGDGLALALQKGDGVALLHLQGILDEHFAGFGEIAEDIDALVLDVSGLTRITSFGVRQWLKAMDALPKRLTDLYFLGCPTFFVDQLNMVLNFGGVGKIVTVSAPYTCLACGNETSETVDILAERARIIAGNLTDRSCTACSNALDLDETPESYFAFAQKYGVVSLKPAVAAFLQAHNVYWGGQAGAESPPNIIKLIFDEITYFRIVGTIGRHFRARPFRVGGDAEVVIDLAEVNEVSAAGQGEWERLIRAVGKDLSTLVFLDAGAPVLRALKRRALRLSHPMLWSVLVPMRCVSCGKQFSQSVRAKFPLQFSAPVCPACGRETKSELEPDLVETLNGICVNEVPEATASFIERREELVSRAMVEASVAASDSALPASSGSSAVLGKFQIVRRLSSGGMAEVFLAQQVGIGGFEKPVALKRILHSTLKNRHLAVDMFLNEAKIVARLSHPNIVQVLDVGEERGALFLAMEYVNGKDLRSVLKSLGLRNHKVSIGQSLHIVHELAMALHHAYWGMDLAGRQHQVVHRDVSPHNILLGFDGTVKLADFGVAFSTSTSEAEQLVGGKWSYMSPEQTLAQGVDHRSDLFALGVIIYQLCTGKLPFSGTKPRDVVAKIRRGAYIPMRDLAPEIPERLEQLVACLLAVDPAQRPNMAASIAEEVLDIAKGLGLELRPTGITALLLESFPEEAPFSNLETPVVLDSVTPWGESERSSPSFQSISPTFVPGDSISRLSVARHATPVSVPIPRVVEPRPVSPAIYVSLILAILGLGTVTYVLLRYF